MREILVDIPEKPYYISIQDGGLEKAGSFVRELIKGDKIFLISNPTVYSLYGEAVVHSLQQSGFQVLTGLMPDGEIYKNMDEVMKLIDQGIQWELERNHAIVALGGGVVGDLAGFVAAIYQRGIDFIQIPTTLLAMVDSSIGGKVAVNHPRGKNLIGAFHQPKGVLIDPAVLKTLPEDEYRCGLGEIIKYGIIYNRSFFEYIENHIESTLYQERDVLTVLIEQSCISKSEIVASDEKEQGIRIILNLGHTFGHAIERLGNYQRFKHGQSVAAGTIMASFLSWKLGYLSVEEKERIEQVLTDLHLLCDITDLDSEQILHVMKYDKKMKNGKLQIVLPREIGSHMISEDIQQSLLKDAIDYGKGFCKQG